MVSRSLPHNNLISFKFNIFLQVSEEVLEIDLFEKHIVFQFYGQFQNNF